MRKIWLKLLMWPLLALSVGAQSAPVSKSSSAFPIAPAEDRVAAAAQAFGQDDDISVVSVTRMIPLEAVLT